MNVLRLDRPLEEPVDPDVSVLVTHAGRAANGTMRARVAIWNSKPLAVDLINPDRSAERRRLARAASQADPVAIADRGAVEMAILRCAEALQGIDLPKPEARVGGVEKRLSVDFPGLVDVVAAADGLPSFLTVGREVATAHEYEGVVLEPPLITAVPWRLPDAERVLGYIGRDADRELFDDVVGCIKRHCLLPSLVEPHEEAYYDLCAAWVFHTHYIEVAAYSPYLGFFAVPERGKTRMGRTLIYLARHGVHTETLREASLFRDSQDRKATLFLDCMGLWEKARKMGADDILLQRFERSAKVPRVLYPDRGPFLDTVYYDVFGRTILATNEPLGRILDTRCVPITMPLATKPYPVPNEADLLPLRERLTAWRARQLEEGWEPGPMAKPADSRLGDVLLPLAQIIDRVAPDRMPAFRALAAHLQRERQRDRSLSWEAAVLLALSSLGGNVKGDVVMLENLTAAVNRDRPDEERLSGRRVSAVLRSLGFAIVKARGNLAAVKWDSARVEEQACFYLDAPDDTGIKDCVPAPCDNANHATDAIPPVARRECDLEASVVSMVSVARGPAATQKHRFSVVDPIEGRNIEEGLI